VGHFLKTRPPEEIPVVTRFLVGRIFPPSEEKKLDVSGHTLWRVVERIIGRVIDPRPIIEEAVDYGKGVRLIYEKFGAPSPGGRLTLEALDQNFARLATIRGPGSRARKEELLKGLLSACNPLEVEYLVKIILGEMRHGVNEGMILEALSRTLSMDGEALRRAFMLTGDIGQVAEVALTQGADGLASLSFQIFRPLKPMLAQSVEDVREAFEVMESPFALEYKLDGARVQVHKRGSECRLYSRHLADITASLPEIRQEVLKQVSAEDIILEGEVLAMDKEGNPLPFQTLMRRFRRVHRIEELKSLVPVRLFLFDILVHEGELLIDRPYQERWEILGQQAGGIDRVPRIIPQSVEEAEDFFQRAIVSGYEGLMAKELSSPYVPGVRGKRWLKIKKYHTLDVVILAAEYGYGRRHGWLSNYHLAVRDVERRKWALVGKTFKGLTDEEFQEITRALKALQVHQVGETVFVRPQIVVEVRFNEIQRSPHYESGLALRFARISRIRWDKSPEEADTLETLRQLFEAERHRRGDRRGPVLEAPGSDH